jgi:flagellar motility protein MotE (MotC chaperone)
MKTLLIGSTVSFLLIFGGVFFFSQKMAKQNHPDAVGAELSAEDIDAAELSLMALEAERVQIDNDRSRLLDLRQGVSAQQSTLNEQLDNIQGAIQELKGEQRRYGEARAESAQKLAKMFDAMKPASAAPIFTSLDRDTALDILVRMKEKSAAKLLSAIEPSLAAQLSTKLSLRGAK